MAGSYSHIKNGGWSFIENMGDAYECVEELFFLVRFFADDEEIKEALEQFHKFKRGESDPNWIPEGSPEFEHMPTITDYGRAYLETQELMES